MAQEERQSQERLLGQAQKHVEDYKGRIIPKEFWEELGKTVK